MKQKLVFPPIYIVVPRSRKSNTNKWKDIFCNNIRNSPVVEALSGAVEQVSGIEVTVALAQHVRHQLLAALLTVGVAIEAPLHHLVVHNIHNQAHLAVRSGNAVSILVTNGNTLVVLADFEYSEVEKKLERHNECNYPSYCITHHQHRLNV